MASAESMVIYIPAGLKARLTSADDLTRYQIYVRLKQINLPHTDPKQMDRLHRILAEICQI